MGFWGADSEKNSRTLSSTTNLWFRIIVPGGLNPHAGDNGLLGSEEKDIIQPAIKKAFDENRFTKQDVTIAEKLCFKLDLLFPVEAPALLHGDLWSGNFLCKDGSIPVLIDPATYYGHPSVDMGMSTLFGGFHSLFYKSYTHWNPLPANYTEQWKACNLYPLLIHLLLYGSSYISQIVSILNDFQ